MDQATLESIVCAHTEGRVLGIFGENRVNVLGGTLNIGQRLGLLQGDITLG